MFDKMVHNPYIIEKMNSYLSSLGSLDTFERIMKEEYMEIRMVPGQIRCNYLGATVLDSYTETLPDGNYFDDPHLNNYI